MTVLGLIKFIAYVDTEIKEISQKICTNPFKKINSRKKDL